MSDIEEELLNAVTRDNSTQRITPMDQSLSDDAWGLPPKHAHMKKTSPIHSQPNNDKPELNWAPSNPMEEGDVDISEKKGEPSVVEKTRETQQSSPSEGTQPVMEKEFSEKDDNQLETSSQNTAPNKNEIKATPEEEEVKVEPPMEEVLPKDDDEVVPREEIETVRKKEVDEDPSEISNTGEKKDEILQEVNTEGESRREIDEEENSAAPQPNADMNIVLMQVQTTLKETKNKLEETEEEVAKYIKSTEDGRRTIKMIELELNKTKDELKESKTELDHVKENTIELHWILQAKNGNYIECYVESQNSPIRASAPSRSIRYALTFASHPGFGKEEFVILDTASQKIWKQNTDAAAKSTISLEPQKKAKLKKWPDVYRFMVHKVDQDVLLQTKNSMDKEPIYVSFVDGVLDIVLLPESQCSDDSIIFKKFEIWESREIMSKVQRGSMTPQELEGLNQCDSMTIAHSRINYGELNLDVYQHVPEEILEIVIPVFARKDTDSSGYVGLVDFLDEFLKFAGEILPPEVTRKMQELRTALGAKCCVHILSIISCLERYYKLEKDRLARMVKQAKSKKDAEDEEHNAVEYDVLVRRLDDRILKENPALRDWQKAGSFQRWWQDFRRRKKLKQQSTGSAGFPLWRHSLLKIQSNFGESTMAYFEFIRWLFLLNFFAAFLYGLFILLPGALEEEWGIDDEMPVHENLAWKLLGRQRNSFYYWGYYKESYGWLDMQLAWLGVASIVIITALFSIINRVLGGDFHKVEKGAMPFCKNVFAAYDHSLTNTEARQLVQNGIMIRLHETLLEELDIQMNEVSFSIICKRILGVLMTVVVAILTVVCIIGLIMFENVISKTAVEHYPAAVVFAEYITPAGVNVINGLFPIILNQLVICEQWSAGIQFQQKFFRTFILRMFSIIVTLIVTANAAKNFVTEDGEEFCKMSVVGEMLLKFIILAIVLELAKKVVFPFILYHLKSCCGMIEKDDSSKSISLAEDREEEKVDGKEKSKEIMARLTTNLNKGKTDFFEMKGDSWKNEFSIPNALVDAMYYQGLMWSAMPFCPAAMPWGALLNTVTFFTTKFYVMNYCCRPKQALGVVHQLKFFYGCILLTLGIATTPIIWLLREIPTCGPIKDQTVRESFDAKLQLAPDEVIMAIDFLTSAVILVPVIATLIMYLKYFRNKYQRKNEQKKSLEDQLMAEKLEKEQIIRDYNVVM